MAPEVLSARSRKTPPQALLLGDYGLPPVRIIVRFGDDGAPLWVESTRASRTFLVKTGAISAAMRQISHNPLRSTRRKAPFLEDHLIERFLDRTLCCSRLRLEPWVLRNQLAQSHHPDSRQETLHITIHSRTARRPKPK